MDEVEAEVVELGAAMLELEEAGLGQRREAVQAAMASQAGTVVAMGVMGDTRAEVVERPSRRPPHLLARAGGRRSFTSISTSIPGFSLLDLALDSLRFAPTPVPPLS